MTDKTYQKLLQEVASLKKEMQSLKDEQIKQRRDNKDMMYNLDSDNIPSLQGVVKSVNLIVNGDGTVNAKLIIDAINGQSSAKLKADVIEIDGSSITLNGDTVIDAINGATGTVKINANRIILDGDTLINAINFDGTGEASIMADRLLLYGSDIVKILAKNKIDLTTNAISIVSDNFEVTSDGVMTCRGALIKVAVIQDAAITRTCILGSDIEEGKGIQVGPALDNGYEGGSVVKIYPYKTSGFAYGDETRGVQIKADYEAGTKGKDDPYYAGSLVADAGIMGASATDDDIETAFVGIQRNFQSKIPIPILRRKLTDGSIAAVWIDENGNLCTTSGALMAGQTPMIG